MMLVRLEQVLRDNGLIAPGGKVLVAVSGGADSIALLHLLQRLSGAFPFSLVAAHLDHRLRPESLEDAEFVGEVCRGLGVELVSEQCDVAALATELGVGLEEAGRLARRAFLERIAGETGCPVIALAHHAEDQAETLLFRLMRGSGLSGLAAMRLQAGPYIRPLLGFSREQVCKFLQQHNLIWRDDASNLDLTFSRNRIRHQLLPLLEQFNPRVVTALNRLSRQAADEEDYWNTVAEKFLERHGESHADGYALKIAPLAVLSRAERRRILRAFLRQASPRLAAVNSEHIEQVEALLAAERPQSDLDLPGLWVGRRYDRLLCNIIRPMVDDYELTLNGPGTYRLPTDDRLLVEVGNNLEGDVASVLFNAAQVPFPLIVRSPRAGDRFQPSGMAGHKSLKNYFVDEKIDAEARRRTPVVCCGDIILWLAGRRRCEAFAPRPGEKLLKMTLIMPKHGAE